MSQSVGWEPAQQVRNITYIIREIGLSTLVVLFFLAREAGWVPSPTIEDHKAMIEVLGYNQTAMDTISSSSAQQVEGQRSLCWIIAKGDKEDEDVCRFGIEYIVNKRR